MTKLSNNFYLGEFLRSKTALRMRYGEQFKPDSDVIENLKILCDSVLQPLRDEVSRRFPDSDVAIKVTSGYRCKRLNRRIGGSRTSDHMRGNAADVELYIDGVEFNRLLFDLARDMDLAFSQMIYEYGTYDKCTKEGEPDWLHLSYVRGKNKCQILRAVRGRTKTIYKRWK